VLETAELQLLSKWCRARRLHWQPGVADDGRPALLLLGVPQQTMLLLPEEDEWHLLDEPGDVLACASGLTELLDALDAGMGAETPDALGSTCRDVRRLDDELFDLPDGPARSRRGSARPGVVFA
jgi:hypothetical protein